jgi:hypothetical protein
MLLTAILFFTSSLTPTQLAIFQPFGIAPLESSIRDSERILGPGAPITGGHPHGGRAWRLAPNSQWLLYVDGFDPVNRPHDQSYLLFEVELIKSSEFHCSKGPIPSKHSSAMGSFWVDETLELSEASLVNRLKGAGLYVETDNQQVIVTPSKRVKEPHLVATFLGSTKLQCVDFSRYSDPKR